MSEGKNSNPYLTSVSLNVYGDDLDPDMVTAALDVEPIRKRIKGQVETSSSGSQRVWQHGYWVTQVDSDDISRISTDIETVAAHAEKIASIPAAAEARFDLYIGGRNDAHGLTSVEFEVSAKALAAMACAGLPLRITITSGPED